MTDLTREEGDVEDDSLAFLDDEGGTWVGNSLLFISNDEDDGCPSFVRVGDDVGVFRCSFRFAASASFLDMASTTITGGIGVVSSAIPVAFLQVPAGIGKVIEGSFADT